jgi:hypothetical protein
MRSFSFSFQYQGQEYVASCHSESGEEGKIFFLVEIPTPGLRTVHGEKIRIVQSPDGSEAYPDSTDAGNDDGRRLVTAIKTGFNEYFLVPGNR